ncbi:hypothetical protein Fmac_028227 [Flemingia macrophylla]|uniref:EF-hand domain-containing protein n=1 Tax=Flemingia macrophylla TaxID=520843 RepID=A0ABD1L6X1_9FABA
MGNSAEIGEPMGNSRRPPNAFVEDETEANLLHKRERKTINRHPLSQYPAINIPLQPQQGDDVLGAFHVAIGETRMAAELEEVFKKFDVNGDGKISALELESIIRSLKQAASEQELKKLIHEVDDDGDG